MNDQGPHIENWDLIVQRRNLQHSLRAAEEAERHAKAATQTIRAALAAADRARDEALKNHPAETLTDFQRYWLDIL